MTVKQTSNLELGLVGNCQVAVLIDRAGRFVWGSFPRMDSDPAFCSLLNPVADGESPGCFDIELVNFASSEQEYVENTAILTTTLRDANGGAVKIIDFAPRYAQFGRNYHPAMVVRNIVPVSGSPAVRIRLRPAAGYGARHAERTFGSSHIRFSNDDYTVRLTTNAPISSLLEERAFVVEQPMAFILGPDESLREDPDKACRDMYGETRAYWQGWVRALSVPYEWQREVIRAAITLKLCTYEDSGAVLAALTTSIPEAANTERNWDYRFCWLRDSYYTVQALNRLGATRTMTEFLRYLFNLLAEHDPRAPLQPVYGITGRAALEERKVESLAGYRDMGPVRIGNDAYRQQQHDVYGATILAATQSFFDRRMIKTGTDQDFVRLEALGEHAAKLYSEPDAGPWEYRGRAMVHTYSSVMCWAGCDRLAKIAAQLGKSSRAAHWEKQASGIRRQILDSAWNDKRKSFVASFGGEDLDASLLILPELGFIAPEDPRFTGTLAAIEGELKQGPYIYRYANPDDFGMPETAFNICTFWYISALAAVGRRDEARELYCNMLEHRTALGLLSEDLDVTSGELWGNFPQTYSMVGIIMAAMRLSRSWEEAL
ncbi:MAG: glycoside hydrolase family 15 protein [Gammaproteobacteria bacterium]|nr:glycoside hydrolase family 15 protein [Gammaproteobacteria bacterium]MDH3507814.1 glycoside hydrolase family 15 protein [Gammaproteobacteria bacterium]